MTFTIYRLTTDWMMSLIELKSFKIHIIKSAIWLRITKKVTNAGISYSILSNHIKLMYSIIFNVFQSARAFTIYIIYTYSLYSREEAVCWNVVSCSWEGGDTGWVHTSAPGCQGQDASSLGSLVFVCLATRWMLCYPLPTPILLRSPNCRASSSENSLSKQILVVSSLIVSRLHWMFWKRKTHWF